MDRRAFSLGACAVSAGLAAAPARADDAPASRTPADDADLIGPILKESGAPALAGAVVAREGVVWLQAAGVRRMGAADPVARTDQWHLGSNTKAMTAALYGRLVEQGLARWEATVPELFGDVRVDPAWANVTMADLMGHRGGLRDAELIDRVWLQSARTDPRPLPVQRRALAAKAFASAPKGTPGVFEYANAGYVAVGAAIEKITRKPWEDVAQAELFDPLTMGSAGFGAPTGDEPWGHSASGAAVDPAGVSDNPRAMGPAGTVHASLEDYARFVRLFLTDGGGVLQPGTVAKLTAPAGTEDRSYALGWITFRERAWAKGPVLAHEGSNTLWHVVALAAPKRGLAMIAVSNDEARGAKAAQALALRLVTRFAPA